MTLSSSQRGLRTAKKPKTKNKQTNKKPFWLAKK
jgi:hypothetical protein